MNRRFFLQIIVLLFVSTVFTPLNAMFNCLTFCCWTRANNSSIKPISQSKSKAESMFDPQSVRVTNRIQSFDDTMQDCSQTPEAIVHLDSNTSLESLQKKSEIFDVGNHSSVATADFYNYPDSASSNYRESLSPAVPLHVKQIKMPSKLKSSCQMNNYSSKIHGFNGFNTFKPTFRGSMSSHDGSDEE